MEKRGLLLVVMLLATSGVVLAGNDDEQNPSDSGKTTRKKKFSLAWKRITHPKRWFSNTQSSFEVNIDVAKQELEDGNYGMAACDVVTAPFYAAWATTLGDVCPCLSKYYFVESFSVGTGIAVGVTATLAYKAWEKRHEASNGVKKLFKSLRSFGSRSKVPEKKTDASTIEA